MSETAGGCVYDGVPLDGVDVGLDGDGRILLSGATWPPATSAGPTTRVHRRPFRTGDSAGGATGAWRSSAGPTT
jgi:O-succinylbenzoic acid--CoA ligase